MSKGSFPGAVSQLARAAVEGDRQGRKTTRNECSLDGRKDKALSASRPTEWELPW